MATFFNIASHWKLKRKDARNLLGGLETKAYSRLTIEAEITLKPDKLTRISFLTGIFAALNRLHGEKIADKWVTLPNSNRIFGGRTPLDYMTRGGIPAMQTVRRLLDARSMRA